MTAPRDAAVEAAVLRAVAYADVFDWPLVPGEVHRSLPVPASPAHVTAAIRALAGDGRLVEPVPGVVTLPGRGATVEARKAREAASRRRWPAAVRAVRAVASVPFVRMVAVTGSLAVGGADDAADVDLLVVVADGRLWLGRALTMLVVRLCRPFGIRLCPNYLVAESALELDDRSPFTAHELVQMVPVAGPSVYRDLVRRNAWYRDYLPNALLPVAGGPDGAADGRDRTDGPLRRLAEGLLGGRLGDRLERWEMTRKVRRLSAAPRSSETRYDATVCKGHVDGHGRRVLAALEARLGDLGLEVS